VGAHRGRPCRLRLSPCRAQGGTACCYHVRGGRLHLLSPSLHVSSGRVTAQACGGLLEGACSLVFLQPARILRPPDVSVRSPIPSARPARGARDLLRSVACNGRYLRVCRCAAVRPRGCLPRGGNRYCRYGDETGGEKGNTRDGDAAAPREDVS